MSAYDALREKVLIAGGVASYDLAPEIETTWVELLSGQLSDLLNQLNVVTGTRHFIRAEDDLNDWYAYVTRNRQYRLGAAADASVDLSVDWAPAIDGWRVSADTVINRQRATVEPVVFPPEPVEVWKWVGTPNLPLTVTSTTPYETTISFSDYVVEPVLDIASTGATPTVAFLHLGSSASLSITSTGTTTITQLAITGRLANRGSALTYTANNAASQALPRGIRESSEIAGNLVGSVASAHGIADHIVWRYAEARKRPSLTLINWFPAFDIEPYDLLAVTSAQLRASGVKFEIVGTSETCERAADGAVSWTFVFQLQEQTLHDPFFTVDTSTLNGADELGY